MSLIKEEDFIKIEQFATTVSKQGVEIEEAAADQNRNDPTWRFLWDRYCPEHKYYTEYLSRLKKIDVADEILHEEGSIVEQKRVNIRRKCLALVEMQRCNLPTGTEKRVEQILKNIASKAQRDTVLNAKRELTQSCEAPTTKDLFSFLIMKLYYFYVSDPRLKKADVYRHRLHALYLINEVLAAKNQSLKDGLMETYGPEPCLLHVAICLVFEATESEEQAQKVHKLLEIWERGQFLPGQAIHIFKNSGHEWTTVLSGWLQATEQNLPLPLKGELNVLIGDESKKYDKEMAKLQQSHEADVGKTRQELASLGRKFLRRISTPMHPSMAGSQPPPCNDSSQRDGPPQFAPGQYENAGNPPPKSTKKGWAVLETTADDSSTPVSTRYDEREADSSRSRDKKSDRRRSRSRSPRRSRRDSKHDSRRSRSRSRDRRSRSRSRSRDRRSRSRDRDRRSRSRSREKRRSRSRERGTKEKHRRSRSRSKELESVHVIDDRSPSEASMDSDDDSLKPKEAWYKSPAALMLRLVPLHEHNVEKPINEADLRFPKPPRHPNDMADIFQEFYGIAANTRRDRFGWSPVTEKYSLYTFMQAKKDARRKYESRAVDLT